LENITTGERLFDWHTLRIELRFRQAIVDYAKWLIETVYRAAIVAKKEFLRFLAQGRRARRGFLICSARHGWPDTGKTL
jgi:hypothetical protein